MAKLIVSLEGNFLREYPLDKERVSIGRRPTNDIHIDNLAMSGLHATLLTIGNDSFLEDLGSTNGTTVNGKTIKKHLLQHDDVIEFGKYHVQYVNEKLAHKASAEDGAEDFEKTMIIRPSTSKPNLATPVVATPEPVHTAAAEAAKAPPVAPAPPTFKPALEAPIAMASPVGRLQVLNGSSMGRELVLNKALITLGKPGVQVAVITKRSNGYFITHVEGLTLPVVNAQSIGVQAHQLVDRDIIELAGVKMEFYFG